MKYLITGICMLVLAASEHSFSGEASGGGGLPPTPIRFSCLAVKGEIQHRYDVIVPKGESPYGDQFVLEYTKSEKDTEIEHLGPFDVQQIASVYPHQLIELRYKTEKKDSGHMLQVAIAVEDRVKKGKYSGSYPARLWRDSSPAMKPEPIEFYQGYCFTDRSK